MIESCVLVRRKEVKFGNMLWNESAMRMMIEILMKKEMQ